jgi:hypothetical protein
MGVSYPCLVGGYLRRQATPKQTGCHRATEIAVISGPSPLVPSRQERTDVSTLGTSFA